MADTRSQALSARHHQRLKGDGQEIDLEAANLSRLRGKKAAWPARRDVFPPSRWPVRLPLHPLLFLDTFQVPLRATAIASLCCGCPLCHGAIPQATTGHRQGLSSGADPNLVPVRSTSTSSTSIAPQLCARHGMWHSATNFPTPVTRPSHLGANVNLLMSQREAVSRCLGHLRKLIAKSSPSCRPECLVLWRRLGTAQAGWASVITEPQQTSTSTSIASISYIPCHHQNRRGIPKARSQRPAWHREPPATGVSRRRC